MNDLNLCIAHPGNNSYSETFIRAHIDCLPTRVFELYNGHWLPEYDGETNSPIIKSWRRQADKLLGRLARKRGRYFRSRAVRRYLKHYGIAAVLAEYGPTGVALASICHDSGIPLIVHFHGFDAYRDDVLETQGYIERYQEIFRGAAALIAVSQDMRDQLISLGAPAGKIYVNPCGVDVDVFEEIDAGSDPVRFLSTGRFVDKKAHYLTILAFQKVLEQIPDATLTVLGGGPLLEVCERIVTGLGIADNVNLPGPVPHQVVKDELRKASVFVLHSVRSYGNDSEGTPVAVLEASSIGLPVISTRHAGIKDAVADNETGFLVNEGDIDGMSEKMLVLARDPALRRKMGIAGRKKMIMEYSMKERTAALWDIVKGSLNYETKGS
jgi:colanic acid/amylovoran biosynthesis glycosyltransferase